MANNWMQKVIKKIKKAGTEGSFREYCGGKVTMECIQKGLKSKDPKVRKRAALAKAFMNSKKAEGGEINNELLNLIDSVSPRTAQAVLGDMDRYQQKMNQMAMLKAALGMEVEGSDGGDEIKKQIREDLVDKSSNSGGLDMQTIKNNLSDILSRTAQMLKEIQNSTDDMNIKSYIDKVINSPVDVIFDKTPEADKLFNYIKSKYGNEGLSPFKAIASYTYQTGEKPSFGYLPHKFKFGGIVSKYAFSGQMKRYADGGDTMPVEKQLEQIQEQQASPESQGGGNEQQNEFGYDISYPQFVQFVSKYPEYFKQLIAELQAQQQQQAGGPSPEQPMQ